MKKRFTLIEIIAVIAVLGILTAIIIPNVSNKKEKAMVTQVSANIRSLQTAMDMYSLEHNGLYASKIQPTVNTPEKIDFSLLYPKYLKKLPDGIMNEYYWVDFMGKVWGSTVDAPEYILKTEDGFEWNADKEISSYNVYEVIENKSFGSARKNTIVMKKNVINHIEIDKFVSKTNSNIIISAIDKHGLETAPVGAGYRGDDWFEPLIDFEGSYEFEYSSEKTMHWIDFWTKEKKPDGTSISYEFKVLNADGTYGEFTNDFYSLKSSKSIIIKVNMEGHNGKLPSLMDFRLYYNYDTENVSVIRPERILEPDGSGNNNEVKYKIIVSGSNPIDKIIVSPEVTLAIKTSDGTPIPTTKEITQTGEIIISYSYSSESISGHMPPIIITKSTQGIISDIEQPYVPNKTKEQKPEIPMEEQKIWDTVQEIAFVGSAGESQKVRWLSVDIKDRQPENTRILYYYATSDGNGDGWSRYVLDFTKLPESRMIKVYAVLQLKKDVVKTAKYPEEYPEVNSIKINSTVGTIDLDTVTPTVVIMANKDNNKNNSIFTIGSNINWTYETHDPQGRKITEVIWSGDKRNKYETPGTYIVKLKVKNEHNYWSKETSYSIEIKDEKPVAVISPTDRDVFSSNMPIDWEYSSSYDSDGDKIIKAEWGGDYSKGNYAAGEYVIKLRVQDEDGYWSDWTEKRFRTTNSIFYNTGENAIDDDINSSYVIANTNVKWIEDLTNKSIAITYQNITSTHENIVLRVEFLDKNGNKLEFQTGVSGTKYYTFITPLGSDKRTLNVIVPPNAVSMKLYTDSKSVTSSSPHIYDIKESIVSELPNDISNITHISDTNKIIFKWNSPIGDFSKVLVYRDNEFVGYGDGTGFTDSPILSNREYKYTFRSVGSTGNLATNSLHYTASTSKNGAAFFGADIKMYDNDINSYATFKTTNVQWDDDLTNRLITITYKNNSSSNDFILRVEFLDKNGTKLEFQTGDSGTRYSTFLTLANTTKTTLDVIVPPNAVSLKLYQNWGTLLSTSPYVYEIKENSTSELPNDITNIQHISERNKITFTWNSPIGDFSKVLVYRDNEFVGYGNETGFTDTPIFAERSYNYTFRTVGSTGNLAKNSINYTANTIKDGITFIAENISLVDADLSTYFHKISTLVRWNEDITGQIVSITYKNNTTSSNQLLRIEFLDINGARIPFQTVDSDTKYSTLITPANTNKTTLDVIAPPNAVTIKLYQDWKTLLSTSPYIYEIK